MAVAESEQFCSSTLQLFWRTAILENVPKLCPDTAWERPCLLFSMPSGPIYLDFLLFPLTALATTEVDTRE
jgi:hypothetical protein